MAVLSLAHVDIEALTLGSSPEFLAIIEAARREIAAGHTLSLAELKQAVETR